MQPGNYTFDVGEQGLGKLVNVFGALLTGKFMVIGITAAAVAIFTFQILDMFLKKDKERIFNVTIAPLDKKRWTQFKRALALIVGTALPLVLVLCKPDASIKAYIAACIISGALCVALSASLRKVYPKAENSMVLLPEAVSIVINVLSDKLASWLARAVMGILNLLVDVIHVPFVENYHIFAVVINAILSIGLIRIIGVSKEMGAANMAGSLIGGIMHAILRHNMIKNLKAKKREIKAELPGESK